MRGAWRDRSGPGRRIGGGGPHGSASGGDGPDREDLLFGPVVDGVALTNPTERIAAGSASSIPLLIGTNLNEGTIFTLIDASSQDLDRAGIAERMQQWFGDRADEVVDVYFEGPGVTAADVWPTVITDRICRVPAALMAERQSKHAPTFLYVFAWQTPQLGGGLGACHGLEIPFVFNLVDRASVLMPPSTPAMEELSSVMHAAWAAFARTGDPNHAGMPSWPAYEPEKRPTMMFDEMIEVSLGPYERERALWSYGPSSIPSRW